MSNVDSKFDYYDAGRLYGYLTAKEIRMVTGMSTVEFAYFINRHYDLVLWTRQYDHKTWYPTKLVMKYLKKEGLF